ncbi:MAG TPA: hypothetical protein VK066_28590 [Chloroflexota bacterium]|nr:hypothetical protein [Chloroflexota bacterium]
MRVVWLLLALLLTACSVRGPWQDGDPWLDDLNEMAVAAFITERSESGLPPGRLEFRAGSIYSTEPTAGPGGEWVWQVRYPRADAIRLPLTARDRLAGVEISADTVIRFEQRYCTLAEGAKGGVRCEAWRSATCCNLVWKRSRGGWLASQP